MVAQIKKELADAADECSALKGAKSHRVKQMEEWAEQLQSLERFKAVEQRKFRMLERNATGDKPQARRRSAPRSASCSRPSALRHPLSHVHPAAQTIEYLKLKQEVAELEKKVADWERKARAARALRLRNVAMLDGPLTK